MKAISLLEPGVVSISDVAEPQIGSEDVLLDVQYVGLCGSDLNAYRASFALVSYPLILGHEISALIAAVGERVPDSVRVGERVTIVPYTHCGVCPACRAGRPNCCQFNQTLGVQRDGALRHRLGTHYTKVYGSKTLSLVELALVEPMSVGYHAANRGQVCEMDTVLVIGCGTIGIGAVAASARKGATVIAADVDDGKLALARRFGAQHTVHSARQDALREVFRLTGGEGVSVAIEAVGLPHTYRLAVDAACYAGRVVYIGYAKETVSFDTTDFVRKELDIRGSRNALRVFPGVIKMMEQGEYPFTELITRVYPFEGAPQALQDWDASPTAYTKILIDLTG